MYKQIINFFLIVFKNLEHLNVISFLFFSNFFYKKFKFFYFFLLIKYRYCIFQNGIGMGVIALK